MRIDRSLLLGLGVIASGALLVVAVAGLAMALRPQPAASRSPARPPATAPAQRATAAAEPTAAPEPITSVHVPILMYHHLKNVGEEMDPEYQQLIVAPQAFLEQMSYLQANGYDTITFAELLGAFEGRNALPAKPVILTFDDGWEDIYTVAYPILRERGMTATFFIATNWLGNVEGTVSWDQIAEMSAGGMEFGSHSATHPYLTKSEPDALRWELEASRSALEEHTGKTITALAYPFGLYDDTVMAAVREAGYLTACTIDAGATARAGELLTLPRLWVYDWTTLEDFAALLQPS